MERTPRTYRHRRYEMQALPGPRGWNIWRPSDDMAFCSMDSLQDAAALIAEDLAGEAG
jgi:hypothetical protein